MFFAADSVGGYDNSGRGPYDDFWYGPIPGRTAAGVRVNDDTAMRLSIVYACISVVSQDLAKVPLHLYRRLDNGGRQLVTDHPIVKLLRKPTRTFTGVAWKERLQAHLLTRGNSYCEIRTNYRGQVTELYPFTPARVRVEVMANQSLRYHCRETDNSVERIVLEGEMMHMRGLSMDGPLGLSPIDQAREALGEAVAAQQYSATFFANDARPGFWLKHPDHFKDEAQRKGFIQRFKQQFGGRNRFSPMIAEYGVDLKEIGLKNVDIQFIDIRKLKNEEICAIFRVPQHKVQILGRATNNNIEHQGIEYVTDCLLTWCRRWEEQLADDLLTESEQEELYFAFELDDLMRGDVVARNTADASAINAGWKTRNEVRRQRNLDPLPGLDDPLEPLNMVPAGSQPQDASSGPAPDDSGAPPTDDAQNARATHLELQARKRVLNRETRALARLAAGNMAEFAEAAATFYAGHAVYVAEALAIERGLAEAYCLVAIEALDGAVKAGTVPALLAGWAKRAESLDFDPLPQTKGN